MSEILLPALLTVCLCLQACASDSDPAYSPDGKTIVFMSDRDGDIEIYIAHPDGTHVQRLTDSPGRDAHPSFSRDGKRIAFQSPRGGRQPQIYVMNADGSGQRRLTALPGFAGVPDWSPGDQEIIFQANMNPTLDPAHWQIFLMKADGSRLRRITHDGYDDQVPKWSPDGSKIAFVSTRTDHSFIAVYDSATRSVQYMSPSVDATGGGRRLGRSSSPTVLLRRSTMRTARIL
jgi:TolB protein